jgi:hypothetical protein
MSGDKGKDNSNDMTGSDAGWEITQSSKKFNKDKRWTGKTDEQVRQDISEREFENYQKPPRPEGIFNNRLNAIEQSKFAKWSAKTNRTYFSDKVLGSSKAKKNIGYTKTEFNQLSISEQNRVYGEYMENRMSGKTDAYGNPTGGWRQENIKHKNKDGTYTTKTTWVGGNDNNVTRKTAEQIAKENQTATNTETDVTITEEEYKKRRGLKGSRSMFGNAGGRGYFDPV